MKIYEYRDNLGNPRDYYDIVNDATKLCEEIEEKNKEIKNLKKLCDEYKEEQDNVFKLWNTKMEETTCYKDFMIYKSRNEKAIEKLESTKILGVRGGKTYFSTLINETIDILKGGLDNGK